MLYVVFMEARSLLYSWSSSLVRAAFSLFCSLLSMRLTVGSWNLAISNKPAWLPKYSECWDFSTSLCS